MKILITEKLTLVSNNDISLDVFNRFGDVVIYDNISREQLIAEIADTNVILCNKTIIDEEIIEQAQNLKYIGTFATGYNNVDVSAATKHNVTVCNAAGYSTNAVAQQVLGYILMHFTKIMQYDSFVSDGGWINASVFSPLVFETDEVYGKTLGIVGYGTIGKAVSKIALALGMKVIVYTRTPKPDNEVEFVSFDELLNRSDVVTLHCPLNAQSENLMNKQSFSKMKNGAFFINTSRGGTVDEEALANALKSGKLSGAAVDVLKAEPMAKDCALYGVPNLIITPHSAWAPKSTRQRLVSLVAENLEAFLNGNPKNVVN